MLDKLTERIKRFEEHQVFCITRNQIWTCDKIRRFIAELRTPAPEQGNDILTDAYRNGYIDGQIVGNTEGRRNTINEFRTTPEAHPELDDDHKPGCFGSYGSRSCNIPGCIWFVRCKQSQEDY